MSAQFMLVPSYQTDTPNATSRESRNKIRESGLSSVLGDSRYRDWLCQTGVHQQSRRIPRGLIRRPLRLQATAPSKQPPTECIEWYSHSLSWTCLLTPFRIKPRGIRRDPRDTCRHNCDSLTQPLEIASEAVDRSARLSAAGEWSS